MIPTVHLDECPEPPAYMPGDTWATYCTCCGARSDTYRREVAKALRDDIASGAEFRRHPLTSASYRMF